MITEEMHAEFCDELERIMDIEKPTSMENLLAKLLAIQVDEFERATVYTGVTK